ncbi:MAG: inorganic phosphate transporter [Bacteroidia bacterium]|nr:inorganic phosphate transporter [Bacteroidia bacterium]
MVLVLFIISSGLFLGWLLGTNDTVSLFGTSISSKNINLEKAAFISGFFIILGAIFQGRGTTASIHGLGNIFEPAIAFSIALCAAIVVLILIKVKLPVSTSQAIVGGIIGWSIFTQGGIDFHLLFKIVSAWILAPVIGIILSAILFVLVRWLMRRSHIHVITLNSYLRIALILVISLAAFGLGANNIGNVIGVFSNFSPNMFIDFGFFSIDGLQILFLLGGISIASGIFTYKWRSNGTSEGILSLTPEAAIVVLLSQALVLFMFSSSWLAGIFVSAGLPPFPLVPVSSTQIVVGAVIGIGIIKGAREIEFKTLAGIGLGWIIAPSGTGLLTYSVLFVFQRFFDFPLVNKPLSISSGQSKFNDFLDHLYTINMVLPGIIILSATFILVFIYLFFRQQKLRLKVEKDMLIQQNQLYQSQKAINELEMKTIWMENEALNVKLQVKRKEFIDVALNINEQRIFLEKISSGINQIDKISEQEGRSEKLKELSLLIKQKMSFSHEKKEFYLQIEDIHKDFHMKLKTTFPNLTDLEKRLAGLLRLNLSTKEISSLLNISSKSVEVARYRLKKKLSLQKDKSLIDFINNL